MSKVKKDNKTSKVKKDKYRVTNWSSYNNSLKMRGSVTIYFDNKAIEEWYASEIPQKGGQFQYSSLCIEVLMMLKVVFHLPYRQTQGFAESLLDSMGLQLRVPSYTQIQRRAEKLEIEAYKIPQKKGEGIVLAIDSTGLKVYGEGEWKTRKHGWSKRRTWRKLHLGVDPDTNYIHCHTMTGNDVDDASQFCDLLDEVEATVDTVTLDGAYDTQEVWDECVRRKIQPIIPPRENAVYWYDKEPYDIPDYPRNKAITDIDEKGRKKWKQDVGYHRRSLSETAMFRFKNIHGPKLYSRKMTTQKTETAIKIKTLNIMTAQGMPVSIRIETA